MNRPHPHDGYVTIDAACNVTIHDTGTDAAVWARTHGHHIYYAEFTPVVDIGEVEERLAALA